MTESKFQDDEIERERRQLVTERSRQAGSKNVDYDKLELKKTLRRIIQGGTQEEFEAKLVELGKGPDTTEGRQLLSWFLSVRRSSGR